MINMNSKELFEMSIGSYSEFKEVRGRIRTIIGMKQKRDGRGRFTSEFTY